MSALSGPKDKAPLPSTIGSEYRVVCGSHTMLNVYLEPGDPYGKVMHHLRHGDIIVALDFKNFQGQTWIQHLVFMKDDSSVWDTSFRDSFLGWSPQDLAGNRNLQCMDIFALDGSSLDALHFESEMIGPAIAQANPKAAATDLSQAGDNFDLSLHVVDVAPGGYDPDNLYAKMIRRELPSPIHVIFETDAALAILETASPAAPFHCVLMPKVPSLDIRDLQPEHASACLRELPKLVAAVKRASGAPAVHVLNSCGHVGYPKSLVPHTHFHVVPCFSSEDAVNLACGKNTSCPVSSSVYAQQATILRRIL